FEDDDVRVVGRAFAITHQGPFTFADGEVEAVEWVPPADLDRWLEARRPMVCPDSLAIVLPHLIR
ncbi:MAG: hypothetical protein J2P45_30940, partial [Candidatus Dormibacteraeota bacterium]|nr:hypothetical protein [Candidatus Dormibacteraeota bacterium]